MANALGQKPWLDDDPARPNPAYFEHVDHLVEFANQPGPRPRDAPDLGLLREGVPGRQRDERPHLRPLARRALQERPNIVWVNGGDRTPTGFEDVFRELAHGLREGDGGAHLITYHPCGWRSSAQFFHDEDWLDFNMIETWTEWSKIYPAVISDALRTPRKPVVLGEGAYENGPEYPQGPITPLVVRRQAWWTVMAGGFHTYGQNQMWRMEPGWDKTFDTPGAAQVCLMKRDPHGAPLVDLIPDQGVFATGVGSERTLNAAMRSSRRPARPRLPLEPHHGLPPPRQDRSEEREGHLDQPGHGRAQGRRHLRHRQPHRQHLPRAPRRSSSRPRATGRTRCCCWRASNSRKQDPHQCHSLVPSVPWNDRSFPKWTARSLDRPFVPGARSRRPSRQGDRAGWSSSWRACTISSSEGSACSASFGSPSLSAWPRRRARPRTRPPRQQRSSRAPSRSSSRRPTCRRRRSARAPRRGLRQDHVLGGVHHRPRSGLRRRERRLLHRAATRSARSSASPSSIARRKTVHITLPNGVDAHGALPRRPGLRHPARRRDDARASRPSRSRSRLPDPTTSLADGRRAARRRRCRRTRRGQAEAGGGRGVRARRADDRRVRRHLEGPDHRRALRPGHHGHDAARELVDGQERHRDADGRADPAGRLRARAAGADPRVAEPRRPAGEDPHRRHPAHVERPADPRAAGSRLRSARAPIPTTSTSTRAASTRSTTRRRARSSGRPTRSGATATPTRSSPTT